MPVLGDKMKIFFTVTVLLFALPSDLLANSTSGSMMKLEVLRELNLSQSLEAQRPQHISAASGLVKARGDFFAVSDDENHLIRIPTDKNKFCETFPIFSGNLPVDSVERKKKKADLEGLGFIEASPKLPYGALLVVPSGSKPQRMKGALVPFLEKGNPSSEVETVDFSPLYSEIKKELISINIEGVVISKTAMKLFNRGNEKGASNAVIDVDYSLSPLKMKLKRISRVDLGQEQGFPISFTDAHMTASGEIWFLAVVEKTDSSYEDGAFLGGYVGQLLLGNKISDLQRQKFPYKPEGIYVDKSEGLTRFYFVTDADDTKIPSQLLLGTFANK